MKQWYAVHTKSGWEKKVVRLLYRKRVENYCPLNKTVWHRGDRKKIVEEPLFRSYVFVHIEEKERLMIRQVEGVINFVYRVDQPVVIKTEEITAMQDFLGAHNNVILEKVGFKLQEAASAGGSLLSEGYGTAAQPYVMKALLSSLGYTLVAEPQTEGTEIIASSAMPSFKRPFYQYGAAVR